jgi:RNA polymerase sigma-70 factor (ECF subfamily)
MCCVVIRRGAELCRLGRCPLRLPQLPDDEAVYSVAMADAFDAGRAAWPDIALAPETFHAHLAARGMSPAADHAADLFLACACLHQVPGALRAFEATYMPRLPAYLSRLGSSREAIDEVAQVLRQQLFVGASPKIGDYSGKGELGAWLRVVAVRLAIDLDRASPPPMQELEPHRSLAAATASPELEALRNRYRDRFSAAFTAALTGLTSEQRTLLRLHYLDGLSMEELGRMFNVNRSTILRRLGACSQLLLDGIRDRLGAELGVSTAELESLAAALRSDLQLSLGDYLKSTR